MTTMDRLTTTRRFILGLAALVALATSACFESSETPVTSRPDEAPSPDAVIADPAAFGINVVSHVPGSQQVEEEAMITEFLRSLPESQRSRFEDVLRDRSATIYEFSGDMILRQLLARIYSIRAADAIAGRRARATRLRQRGVAVVTIMLSEQGLSGDEDAVLHRRASEDPFDVIVVRPSAATGNLLRAALAAFHRASRAAPIVDADTRTVVRGPERGSGVSSDADAKLDEIRRRSVEQTVPGLGRGMVFTMTMRIRSDVNSPPSGP